MLTATACMQLKWCKCVYRLECTATTTATAPHTHDDDDANGTHSPIHTNGLNRKTRRYNHLDNDDDCLACMLLVWQPTTTNGRLVEHKNRTTKTIAIVGWRVFVWMCCIRVPERLLKFVRWVNFGVYFYILPFAQFDFWVNIKQQTRVGIVGNRPHNNTFKMPAKCGTLFLYSDAMRPYHSAQTFCWI